jgi:ribosomal protein S27AE
VGILETRAALACFEKLKPPNHGYRREVASLLQSYAGKPSEETKKQLAEFLPPEALKTLKTERARELANAIRRKERRSNDEFTHELVAKVRGLARDAVKRGMAALILVDPIDSGSLRGTRLQGTLLRARKLLRNMATYEGAAFRAVRASGKVCPRRGCKGEETVRTKHSRIYECPRCGMRWDRDKGVHYNLIYSYFERLRKEDCGDDTVMAERILTALKEWLEEHSNILTY